MLNIIMANTIEQIKQDLSKQHPPDIINSIIDSYIKIRENFYLNKHEPAELNGGKFVEACVRLLQNQINGSYTPIGSPIRNIIQELRNFEQTPRTHHESYRLHIPRALISIYNLRNRRGVGHLSNDVNPNIADSALILATASWVIAEIYRLHHTLPIEQAQKVINDIVAIKIPLVINIQGIKRVLATKLTAADQTLLLLYSESPNELSIDDLIKYIEYSNRSRYESQIIRSLHKNRLINCKHKQCIITPLGIKYVEQHYNEWSSIIN